MASSTDLGLGVGITNPRLGTAKRGIAVEIAAQLAAATTSPVCLVGADPTDRDVERHLPQLISTWGEPTRLNVTRGPHHLEVANFSGARVCVVSVSDRDSVEMVFRALQERFRFMIVDAPSRAGIGVGIAAVLLEWLDALVVATALGAGELAETRQYVERLDVLPAAHHVDVRVLAIGDPRESGLECRQLDGRLATLPTIGHVPRLGGGVAKRRAIDSGQLDTAFGPVVRWIVDQQPDASSGRAGSDYFTARKHLRPPSR